MSHRSGRLVDSFFKPVEERTKHDLNNVLLWFRQKSELPSSLPTETLLDVILHCEFVTKQKDDVIIHQGEKGHKFYIILRGSVSVLHKESLEDVDLGEEVGHARNTDRNALGNMLITLREGATFGEIALINPDCIRTASVVAEEKTDLVVIHRELYNRSVSKVVAKEYAEKINFIESLPICRDWSKKMKKHLAASLRKEAFSFDRVIFRQGEKAQDMHFIVSGEIKLVVDPEAHFSQFEKFMKKCSEVLDGHNAEIKHESAYFPQKLLPQLQRYSRVSRISRLQRPPSQQGTAELKKLPQSWSPSAIRKLNAHIHSKKVHLSLCYLGSKQCVGDVELLLGLDLYHATAVCSQETVVMALHRTHFERLFRRRNPRTVKDMAHTLELQLARRVQKPNIVEYTPLLKCFIYRIQELLGRRRFSQDNGFEVPNVVFETHSRGRQSRQRDIIPDTGAISNRDALYSRARSSIGSRATSRGVEASGSTTPESR